MGVRNLFVSEARMMGNIAASKGIQIRMPSTVLREFYCHDAAKDKRRAFNIDFRLEFNVEDLSTINFVHDCNGGMSAILPNTLGAEVFLTMHKASTLPLILELMGGQAFPPKYFRDYLQQVESAVLRAAAESGFLQRYPELSSQDIVGSVRPRTVRHSRVFVIGNDVCFLFCPKDAIPQARGERFELARAADCEILIYVEDSKITYIDGWLRTEVKESEFKLVATPVPAKNPVR